MPVYVRKNLLSITPESLSNGCSDGDDYISDPDQMIDYLPQPFRLVNKIVTSIFDKAWEHIGHREILNEEKLSRISIPEYGSAEILDQYKASPGMVESPDGTAVFLGLPSELIVLDPITRQPIVSWTSEGQESDQNSEVTSITTVQIGVQACLIVSINNKGRGRLHIYSNPLLLFVKDLETDMPSGSKVLEGFVSEDGNFIGLMAEGKDGDVWLDVFKLPRDSWLKDIDNVQSELNKQQEMHHSTTEEGKGDSKPPSSLGGSPVPGTNWNPNTLAKATQILRITAPHTSVSGSSCVTLPGVSTPATEEWISNIGVGKKHQLTEQHLQLRRTIAERELAAYLDHHPKNIDYDNERSKSCLWLIINKSGRLSPGQVTSSDHQYLVCAWKNTSYLNFFDLQKPSKDIERKPDRVVPFGADVTALTSSPCGILVAVGLQDGSVILFDEFVGLPLFVESVGRSEVTFLTIPVSSSVMSSTYMNDLTDLLTGGVIVVTGTKDGRIMTLTLDCSTRQVTKVNVRKGTKEEREQMHTMASIKSLHNVLLLVTKGGEVSMLDFLTGQKLCKVKIPSTYTLNSLYFNNMLSMPANGQQIFLKATRSSGDEEEATSGSVKETVILAYHLQSFSCLDSRWKTLTEQEPKPPTLLHSTPLNKRVDLLLTKHLRDSLRRRDRIMQRWEMLKNGSQLVSA